MLERLLEQLRHDLGIEEPLLPKDDGAYVVDFDPDLYISLSENADQSVRLFCKLAPLPKENREEFLRTCMVGNLLGRETGGASLGVDDQEDQVCLAKTLEAEVSYREFRDALEEFVNHADAWRKETLVFTEVNRNNG